MAANGADLIELGIPFSDPTAEGPVIQGANLRALPGGVTTDQIFASGAGSPPGRDGPPGVHDLRQRGVLLRGGALLLHLLPMVGMDGLILPDVPFEEKGEFQAVCREARAGR